MNRIQFWVLTGLSSFVVLLAISQILLGRQVNEAQNQVSLAQQKVNLGQAAQGMMKQLAIRIYSDSEKNHDQKLKDLLKRQSISYNPGTDATGADAPATTPATPANR